MGAVEDGIRKFITAEIMYEDDESTLGIEDPLLESGILDSAGLITLVTYLDDRFSISVPPEELVPENFDTVQAIANFVNSQTS